MKNPYLDKKVAYVFCLGVIALVGTELGIIGILPQIAAYYRIGVDQAGMLISGFAMVIAIAGPLMVLFTSRFDQKALMLFSIACFFLTAVVSAFAPPFWLLVVVRLVPAFFHPVFYSTAIGIIMQHAKKEEASSMVAIALSGITIVSITIIPLSVYLTDIFDWRAAFVLQAATSALTLFLLYKKIPVLPRGVPVSFKNQLGILRKRNVLLTAFMIMSMVAAWFCTYSYLADYLAKVNYMNNQEISYAMFLFGLTGIFGNWLTGRVLTKGIILPVIMTMAGTFLIYPGLYFSGDRSVAVFVTIGISGFLYAPVFLVGSVAITKVADQAIAFGNSIAASFTNLGIAIGTFIGGWMVTSFGITHTPLAGIGCAGCALVCLALLRK